MKKPRTYATAQAFRIALENRVKASAKKLGHLDANRRRQLLLADRLLTRLALEFGDSLIAKGGIALELRLPFARATRELDVTVKGTSNGLFERLQSAGRRDLADWLRFENSAAALEKVGVQRLESLHPAIPQQRRWPLSDLLDGWTPAAGLSRRPWSSEDVLKH